MNLAAIAVALLLPGCGGAPPTEAESPSAAAPPATAPSATAPPAAGPIEAPARSEAALRAMVDAALLEEAARPAFVADRRLVPLRGRRFFVYDDVDALGVSDCRPLPGVDRDGELLIRVPGARDPDGSRHVGEVLLRHGVVVTDGYREGPGAGSVTGGAEGLPYALAVSDAEHRVYAGDARGRVLACAPEPRAVRCASGEGEGYCMESAPMLISRVAGPGAGFGRATPELPESACEVRCAPNPCEDVLGPEPLRRIRRVYGPDGPQIAVFRAAADCRRFARERAPLRPWLLAQDGRCECETCERPRAAEDCYERCERACGERHRELLEGPPPALPTPPAARAVESRFAAAEVSSRRYAAAAAHWARELSACARSALERAARDGAIADGWVSRPSLHVSIREDGTLGPARLDGDALPEPLAASLHGCAAALPPIRGGGAGSVRLDGLWWVGRAARRPPRRERAAPRPQIPSSDRTPRCRSCLRTAPRRAS